MFITSDLHFMHKRIREFAPEYRPWEDMEHMTEALIEAWNKCATTPGVKMYHLGDFCFGTEEDTRKIASRLQGILLTVLGTMITVNTEKCLQSMEKLCIMTK